MDVVVKDISVTGGFLYKPVHPFSAGKPGPDDKNDVDDDVFRRTETGTALISKHHEACSMEQGSRLPTE